MSAAVRDAHSDVPWSAIVGMRNVLVHDYFGIDLAEVWSTVERDLPALRPRVPPGGSAQHLRLMLSPLC
jgi:uncharacterized protein with HEPN domain